MKSRFFLCVILAFAVSAFAISPVNAQLANTPWPMFHHDVRHTGQGEYAGPLNPMLAWSYETGGDITSSPAIAPDSKIYVGSNDVRVYGFTQDGRLSWSYRTAGNVESSPAIDFDGCCYIGSNDNRVRAISSAGALLWSYKTGGFVRSSPTIDSDGRIYVGSDDYFLYALNSNGSLAWSKSINGAVWSSPSIGYNGNIYIGSQSSKLYALDSSGLIMWSYGTYGGIWSAPAIDVSGNLYYGNETYDMNSVTSDGALRWTIETGGQITSSPVIGSSSIYFSSDDGKIWASSLAGAFMWSYECDWIGWSHWASPVLDSNERIYSGVGLGEYFALNSNGTLLWSYRFTDNIGSTPAIDSNGRLYIGTDEDILYCFKDSPQPTPIPTQPQPTQIPKSPAEILLNGSSFNRGGQFTATFTLNEAVTRTFNAYAVVNLPDGSMLDAITLSSRIKPVATNVNGLPAGFSYPLMSITITPNAPKGNCTVMVGFFDPHTAIHGPNDAFLLATTPFTLN